MEDNNQKARDLITKGEEKLSGSKGFLSRMLGKGGNKEEALEYFVNAGNLLKLSKSWNEAGNIFSRAATLYLEDDNKLEACTKFSEAANCYKKSNPSDACSSLLKAIDIYIDSGRFSMAAKHTQSVAELYETSLNDNDSAAKFYLKAADLFKGEESNSAAKKNMIKVADIYAIQGQFREAIKIYEEYAAVVQESPLMKYSAKEYYFKAGLCYLCVDFLDAQRAMDQYEIDCPSFVNTREIKLVKDLASCMEEHDSERFSTRLQTFDDISRIDKWQTSLLLLAKTSISSEDDLC